MSATAQIAKHFRDAFFGGNWTFVSLKPTLENVTLEMANTKVHSLNTIAILVCHINYYVSVQLRVLEGGPLEGSDKRSFAVPELKNEQDWQDLLAGFWANAEKFAALVEKIPDEKLDQDFADPKYGSYHRNLLGIIEHTHYHMGQISLIKKIIAEG